MIGWVIVGNFAYPRALNAIAFDFFVEILDRDVLLLGFSETSKLSS